MPRLDRAAIVAQIVTDHPATARVFQKHGIDYCCHGNVSLSDASRERRLDPNALIAELEAALAMPDAAAEESPTTFSTPALIAKIVDRHHGYLRRALPYIAPIAEKVARVHGDRNPKLRRLRDTFQGLSKSLGPHLDEEEGTLFPALMARTRDPHVVNQEIVRMHDDHLVVGGLLAEMRALSADYSTPEWGCNTYRVLMAELDALEADILRHVHLENHVLAPRFAAHIDTGPHT
jgi:regulator of cell morphogenesis and NO signaling